MWRMVGRTGPRLRPLVGVASAGRSIALLALACLLLPVQHRAASSRSSCSDDDACRVRCRTAVAGGGAANASASASALGGAAAAEAAVCDGVICDTTYGVCSCGGAAAMQVTGACVAMPMNGSELCSPGLAYPERLVLALAVPPSPEIRPEDLHPGESSAALLTALRRSVADALRCDRCGVAALRPKLAGESRGTPAFDGSVVELLYAEVEFEFCATNNETSAGGPDYTAFSSRFEEEAKKYAALAVGSVRVLTFQRRATAAPTPLPTVAPSAAAAVGSDGGESGGVAAGTDSGSGMEEGADLSRLWWAFALAGIAAALLPVMILNSLWLRHRKGQSSGLPRCITRKLDEFYDGWVDRRERRHNKAAAEKRKNSAKKLRAELAIAGGPVEAFTVSPPSSPARGSKAPKPPTDAALSESEPSCEAVPASPGSVKDLKQRLRALGVNFSGCTEKAELLELLRKHGGDDGSLRALGRGGGAGGNQDACLPGQLFDEEELASAAAAPAPATAAPAAVPAPPRPPPTTVASPPQSAPEHFVVPMRQGGGSQISFGGSLPASAPAPSVEEWDELQRSAASFADNVLERERSPSFSGNLADGVLQRSPASFNDGSQRLPSFSTDLELGDCVVAGVPANGLRDAAAAASPPSFGELPFLPDFDDIDAGPQRTRSKKSNATVQSTPSFGDVDCQSSPTMAVQLGCSARPGSLKRTPSFEF